MKILLVIDSLGAGGAQNQLSLLAAGLKENGHNVSWFQYFDNNFFKSRLDHAQVPVHLCAKRDKLGLNVLLALTRLIRQQRFDIVLSYLDTPNFYAAAACVLCRKPPALIISHRNTTQLESLPEWQRRIRQWTNKRAKTLVCNSVHESNVWQGVHPDLSIVTIYNGIPDTLTEGHDIEQPSGDMLGLDPGDANAQLPVLLAVGTITPRKNAHRIVEAMQQLKKNGLLDFRVVWVGRAKANLAEDVEYAEQLKHQIESAGLSQYWHWAGQQPAVQPWYLAATALIHAGTEEGLPNVVCEAQMLGVPVIISRVLDHPMLIKDGYNGVSFDPENPAELAAAISSFLALAENERSSMRLASRAMAVSLYGRKRCIDEYLDVFKAVLPNNSEP